MGFDRARLSIHYHYAQPSGGNRLPIFFPPVPPPLDTPSHVHANEDELFVVLEGEHEFTVGDTVFDAGPGAVVFAPRGVPHSHRRVVPRTGRFLTLVSPAGFEGFFRELSEAERDGTIGPDAYVRASERYGITWLR